MNRVRRVVIAAALCCVALLVTSCISDGTYVVGGGSGQVRPGTYWSPGERGCYYERLRSFSGASTAIIANEFVSAKGTQIVTIARSDAGFQTEDCGPWIRLDNTPLTNTPTSPKLGEWTYRVGVDIAAGRWTANPPGPSCYWERLSGFGHTSGDIISNKFGAGPQVVQIRSGDKGFSSTGCGTWTYRGR